MTDDLRTAAAPDLTFTLANIRRHRPCADGWKSLLTALGENHAAPDLSRRVSLGDVARANGAVDAFWCVRALNWSDIAVRRAVISGAIMPAVKRAAAFTTDPRVYEAIEILDRWCGGDDTADLGKAWAERAAEAAAWAAERAAEAAAWAARAAEAAWAERAAEAAAWAAERAAEAAAAAWAAWAAWAAVEAAEAVKQRADIIAAFPPVAILEEVK